MTNKTKPTWDIGVGLIIKEDLPIRYVTPEEFMELLKDEWFLRLESLNAEERDNGFVGFYIDEILDSDPSSTIWRAKEKIYKRRKRDV